MQVFLYVFGENWSDGTAHYYCCRSIDEAIRLFKKDQHLEYIEFSIFDNNYGFVIGHQEDNARQFILSCYPIQHGQLAQERIQ